MDHRLILALTAAGLLLAACGGVANAPVVSGDGERSGQREDGVRVDCGGSEYDPARLAGAPLASSLPDGPAGAVDDAGAPAFDPSQDWRVVNRSDDRVDLIRELDEPFDNGGGDVRTHESRTLQRIAGATNVPDGTWLLTSAGPCAQRLLGADLGEADLTLAGKPSPDSATLALLVHEWACASGRTAEGRIELVALEETADQVRLRIGVRRLDGGQDCQGNPPTPFTVELAEPLGDREIVDASTVPARSITVAADPEGSDAGDP